MNMAETPDLGDPPFAHAPSVSERTIVSMFRDVALSRADERAFRSRSLPAREAQGHEEQHPGHEWGSMAWADYGLLVDRLASAFVQWGIDPGDRVAILSENRWEWHVADVATMMVGAVSVPVYPTSSISQTRYVLEHCGAKLCVLSNLDQFRKVLAGLREESTLEHLVLLDEDADVDNEETPGIEKLRINVWTWHQMIAMWRQSLTAHDEVEKRRSLIRETDIATIVYTSGTTGPPKGVMLSHRNIVRTIDMIRSVVPLVDTDRCLSFLPLSHIAERIVSHFGQIASGGETWFAESFSTVAADIVDCQPTLFFAVPRVWEKARDSFEIELHRMGGIRKIAVRSYLQVGKDVYTYVDSGRPPRVFSAVIHRFLDRSVGQQIRSKIGLKNAKALFSGAAPIDPDLLAWLRLLGLHVGEVYGQTEVCGPTTVSPPAQIRIGTVGPPLPGVELKIADDSEVLVRGPNVCVGYYCNDVASQELFDDDGWMRSGDLGALDRDGYLRITGRKKDLMKTAQGKYIAPQELETRLRSARFIANAVVVAEGRPFVTAVLTLDPEAVVPWADHRGKSLSLEALSKDLDVLGEIKIEVDNLNKEFSHPEQVKRWCVLPRDFTLESGELTPTLKTVRPVVLEHFSENIEAMYSPALHEQTSALHEQTSASHKQSSVSH
jgi:long-chain acyl-CoA synthetase